MFLQPLTLCEVQPGLRLAARKLLARDLLAPATQATLCLGCSVTGPVGQGSVWDKCLETGLKSWHLCLPGKSANLFILCQELKQ